MSESQKKKYIYCKGQLVEVSQEVYKEYYQPIWRERKRHQKSGECHCPRKQLYKCDGVCIGCEFYTAGKIVSLETKLNRQTDNLTLGDVLEESLPSSVEAVERAELYDALYKALDQLEPNLKNICLYFMAGKSEREIAALLGRSQSTINYQKRKALRILHDALVDYL